MRFPVSVIGLLLVLAPTFAAAQRPARAGSIAGTWVYAGTRDQGEAIASQAIDPVVAAMRPDLQEMARDRIAESTWLPTTIRIAASRSRIQVALTGQERRNFNGAPGRTISVPMRHGYAQLVQTLRPDGSVAQEFTAIDGTQENVYSIGADRSLIVDVTLRSNELPNEIHFRLVYQRAR